MHKITSMRSSFFLFFTLIFFSAFSYANTNSFSKSNLNSSTRYILIDINSMNSEMPVVAFDHLLHETKIASMGKDCSTCHDQNSNGQYFNTKFKNIDKQSKAVTLKDEFHKNCISCHNDFNRGPKLLECRTCHDENIVKVQTLASSHQSKTLEFSGYLHNYHSNDLDLACERCHHDFDAKKLLINTNFSKQNCETCHKAFGQNVSDNEASYIIPLQSAEHLLCLGCHYEIAKESGVFEQAKNDEKAKLVINASASNNLYLNSIVPISCTACHNENLQKDLEEYNKLQTNNVKYNQVEDIYFNVNGEKKIEHKEFKAQVYFNHKAHQNANLSCSTCHHKQISSCSACHTEQGSINGNFVNSYTAMHSKKADNSCVGCHNLQAEKDINCSGCHNNFIAVNAKVDNCSVCHIDIEELGINDEKLSKIPEIVEIDVLSNEYGAVKFPHRQIYDALIKRTENSNLASSFHNDFTMCVACHHNTGMSNFFVENPPACESCHGRENDIINDIPSLKVAYHNNCMKCHEKMQIEKVNSTDCGYCHVLKK